MHITTGKVQRWGSGDQSFTVYIDGEEIGSYWRERTSEYDTGWQPGGELLDGPLGHIDWPSDSDSLTETRHRITMAGRAANS